LLNLPQVRGFAPIGILECWNAGILERWVEPMAWREYWTVGLMATIVLAIKIIMDNIL
jgi:hypothetical protein